MKLQERKSEELDVNMTPLIDVVFLLLIFFVLTTTFQKEARLKVDLPSSSAAEQNTLQEPIEITISSEGEIMLQGSGDWRAQLQQFAEGGSEHQLVIRADSNSPHGAVVQVMDAAQQFGIINLSIATESTH